MARTVFSALVGLVLFAGASSAGAQSLQANLAKGQTAPIADHLSNFAPDRLLVKFREGLAQPLAENAAKGLGAASVKQIHHQGLFLVKLEKDKNIQVAKEAFEKNALVEFVELDYVLYADDRTPNDPEFSKQWGLHNTGQVVNGVSGTPDADIDAPAAWDRTTGSSQVVIAIIDAGVAWDHPDLQANIWRNTDESLDGIDNDGNGYIDDIRGWDFVDDDNNPYDFNGHGSHVAGIAAAVGNNGVGITGVSWTAQIMPLRFLGVLGGGFTSDAIQAVDYAAQNGAKIINASFGSSQFSSSMRLAIENAKNANVLFVAAAGNEGSNNDISPHYPSNYDLDNIIAVAATTQSDNLASFSNFGVASVDVGAPGTNIYSTVNVAPAQRFFDNVELGISNWEKQTPWDTTRSQSFSPTHSWADSPSGNYANNVNTSLTLKNGISLQGYEGAKLEFKLWLDTESCCDYLWIEASTDKTNWTALSQLAGSTGGRWFDWENDLSEFDGASTVYIRFRLTSDGSVTRDGAYIDDVKISAFPPGPYTYTGSEYEFFNGTSMAAPHVAGLAALVLSRTPSLTYSQIRNTIFETVDPLTSLAGRVATGGRINARTATLDPPDITTSIVPSPFNFSLNFGDSTTAAITLGNVGQRDLKFQISDVDSSSSSASLSRDDQQSRLESAIQAMRNRAIYRDAPEGDASDKSSGETSNNKLPQQPHEAVSIKYAPRAISSSNIALLGAENTTSNSVDVQTTLMGTGNFASITIINTAAVTPTVPELQAFDAVMVWSNSSFLNSTTFGDNLADYIDGGGRVVLALFAVGELNTARHLRGRFLTDDYYAINVGGFVGFAGNHFLGVVHDPGHPIMNGVTSFDGGVDSFRPLGGLAAGATRIADWDDGNILVATKTINGIRRVDLGLWPVSANTANGWNPATDGGILMANALLWVTGVGIQDWLVLAPTSGTIAQNSSATINGKVRTLGLLPGNTYYKKVNIASNDPDESIIRIPATLHINPVPFFVLFDPNSSTAEGYATDVVTHALRIRNYGQNNDSYNLTRTGNLWQTQIFDSTGTTQITTTPTVAAGGNLKILVKVTVASGAQDTARVTATSVGDPSRSSVAKLTTKSLGARGTVPWSDAFPTTTLDPVKWPFNNGPAVVNTLGSNEPSLPNSLNLDGTSDNRGDEVRTQAINLAGQAGIRLRYYYQAGGTAEAPDFGDSLKVDYQNAAGSWVNLAGYTGNGSLSTTFTLQEFSLPAAAHHANFRLRFRVATSSGSGLDDWFVDDVSLALPSPVAVTPTSFDVFATPGDSVNKTLTIANNGSPGSAAVTFSINALSAASAALAPSEPSIDYPASYYDMEIGKGEVDPRDGPAVVSGRGGPDLFGHVWIDSDEPNGPSFNWVDISTNGTVINGLGDETNVGPFNIGFTFPFYGNNFTTFRVSSNGFISFTSTASDLTNDPLPSTTAPFNLLALFWDDLVVDFPGAVYYRFDGQKLIVEYKDVRKFGSSSRYTFEGLLYPSGDIVFQYLTMPAPVNQATVGIQNAFGTDGLQMVFNANYLHNNLAVLISSGLSWLSFNPASGSVAPGASQNVAVKFNARGLPADTVLQANITVNTTGSPSAFTIPATLRTQPQCTAPTHFTFAANTGNSYAILIDDATLDGVRLELCDEIGVFTPAGLCVGAVAWNDTLPLGFSAWEDNPQTPAIDGYRAGDRMSFRVWDDGASTEYSATPTYTAGNGNFGSGVFARLSLSASSQQTQAVNLRQGWNWISSNIEPRRPQLDSVFANVAGLEILQNCAGKFYIPNAINQIGNWNPLESYIAYMNRTNTVTFRGRQMLANTPILLIAGWNCIPYLPQDPLAPQTALQSIIANLNIVKDDSGHFFIPNVVDNIKLMRSGRGYKAHLSAAATLIYPASSAITAKVGSTAPVFTSTQPAHFDAQRLGGESYSIVVKAVKVEGLALETGDEIAVFRPEGRCVGVGVWNADAGVAAIAAWQDNPRTEEIDGFVLDEPMSFRLWNKSGNVEIDLTPVFEKGAGTFGSGPYALVRLEGNSLPKVYALEQNYPNPFNPETIIQYQLPQAGHVTIKIFNVLGQVVRTLVDEPKGAGYHRVLWDGKNDLGQPVASGLYLNQMSAGSFSKVKRMLLIR